MTGLLPSEVIDNILDKTDIVEVVSSRIPLKKTGRNYKTNCPFHNEKTPSFIVSPEKQIYHCFGCGAGGNALGFLMKYEKLDFREALSSLADKVGIKLPAVKFQDRALETLTDKLCNINGIAKDFYRNNLLSHNGSFCYKYLTDRAVTSDTIKIFQLGYAPGMWEGLISFFKNKGIGPDFLEKAGLVVRSEKDKGFYDRFRNRLIFPIFDIRNRVIGFGGRVLNEAQPKYINSPETLIYTKGKHLYGLNFSKSFVREKDYAVIVEGYLDLIIPFQCGIKNIVATLGTALTTHHIRLLKRFTRTVVMVFDSDKAGEEASLRGLDLLVSLDMNVRIAALPKGYDPDSFVRKQGKEAFENIIKSSKDLFDYKMNLLMNRFNKDGVRGKAAIATLMLPTIARISNEILKAAFLKKLSEMLSIDEAALKAELKKVKIDYSYTVREEKPLYKQNEARHAELLLLSLILEEPGTLPVVSEKLGLDEFRDTRIRKIIDLIYKFCESKKVIIPSKIINHFENDEIKKLISKAVSIRETIMNKEKVLFDCINRVREDNFREDLKKLQNEIRSAHDLKDTEKVDILLLKYNDLIKAHRK